MHTGRCRRMVAQGSGIIINMSSESGLEGSEGQSVYAASKNAVNSLPVPGPRNGAKKVFAWWASPPVSWKQRDYARCPMKPHWPIPEASPLTSFGRVTPKPILHR